MAAYDFSARQAAARMAEAQPIQSLLMQINADAVCLVRTQFQQRIALRQRCRARFALDLLLPQSGTLSLLA